jgi:hypothetical protein
MPYKVEGKCVYKKDTGKKVGCTKGDVKDYLAALHANADVNESNKLENKITAMKLKENEMIEMSPAPFIKSN